MSQQIYGRQVDDDGTIAGTPREIATDDKGRVRIILDDLLATRVARVARVAHLASAALPGAGAYTNQSAYSIPDGAQFITCWIAYTRGAAGGYAKFKAMLGNGTEESACPVVDPVITVVQPHGRTLFYPNELVGPTPPDASAVGWIVTFDVRGGATAFRLLAAELGVTATPGTCAIALTAGH